VNGASPVTIDVVVCTYNNAPLLDETLAALGRQRVPSENVDWRVVVVDNNCTDDTPEVVAAHVLRAAMPLRLVRETEQGLTPARLRGVRETTADWIAFVDDDCVLDEDWIERAAAFARAHPTCGAFGGQVVLDWEEAPSDVVARYAWAYAHQQQGDEPKRMECLAGAGMVIRRSALEASGWVEQRFLQDRVGDKLISGGDVEMALRLGAEHELWYEPSCSLRHRIPARRGSLRYLNDVVYGLGSSKLLGDSMLWPGSYRRWLLTSLVGSREWAVPTLRFAARALLGRGGGQDARVTFSFLRGWWAGIVRLLRMDAAERRALLGCALPKVDPASR